MTLKPGNVLQLIALADFPMIQKGDNLADIIQTSLKVNQIDLQDGDVVVIAQKVISKAEGRQVGLETVVPSSGAEALAQ